VSSRPEKPCTGEQRNYLSQKQVKKKKSCPNPNLLAQEQG